MTSLLPCLLSPTRQPGSAEDMHMHVQHTNQMPLHWRNQRRSRMKCKLHVQHWHQCASFSAAGTDQISTDIVSTQRRVLVHPVHPSWCLVGISTPAKTQWDIQLYLYPERPAQNPTYIVAFPLQVGLVFSIYSFASVAASPLLGRMVQLGYIKRRSLLLSGLLVVCLPIPSLNQPPR